MLSWEPGIEHSEGPVKRRVTAALSEPHIRRPARHLELACALKNSVEEPLQFVPDYRVSHTLQALELRTIGRDIIACFHPSENQARQIVTRPTGRPHASV
jgi:hypothetical protein